MTRFDLAQGSHRAVEQVRKRTGKVRKKRPIQSATRDLILFRLNGKE